MNFFNSLAETMPDVVDTCKFRLEILKKIKIINFILSLSLEGTNHFCVGFQIPQQIIVLIVSFIYQQKLFFQRPVLVKINNQKIHKNENVFIRKCRKSKNHSLENKRNSLISQQILSCDFVSENNQLVNNMDEKQFYELRVIKVWQIKSNEIENKNNLFKKWRYLHDFLNNVQIVEQNKQSAINYKKIATKCGIKCRLICWNRNLVMHEIQCLQSFGKSKVAHSTEISSILSLIKKSMIIFTLTTKKQNIVKTMNFLLVHDKNSSLPRKIKVDGSNHEKLGDSGININYLTNSMTKILMDESMVFFNEEKEQWEISPEYQRFGIVKEIYCQKNEFIYDFGNQFYFNGYDFTQIS